MHRKNKHNFYDAQVIQRLRHFATIHCCSTAALLLLLYFCCFTAALLNCFNKVGTSPIFAVTSSRTSASPPSSAFARLVPAAAAAAEAVQVADSTCLLGGGHQAVQRLTLLAY
jgi:hypothetical protein